MRWLMPILVGLMLPAVACAARSSAAVPPERVKPTTTTERDGCAAADCHADVKQYAVVHGPVADNSCDACHQLVDPATHTFKLWREKAETCTFCHEFGTGGMPVVHKPVQTGECLGCHNPHGGPGASMMRENSMSELCGRCHDVRAMSGRFQHKPVKDGECDSCHQPHASKYPKLVDATGKDFCLFCHKDFKQQMDDVEYVHQAQEEGCRNCHDVHASNFPKQVRQSISDLCLGCHEKIKAQVAQAVQHPATLGERACISCHTAHGGDLASLMADDPIRVCLTCHKEPVKDEKGKQIVAAMTELADPKAKLHGPIRDGQCGDCHSVHGGEKSGLLLRANTPRFYDKFSVENYEMCFSCHDPTLVAEDPSGAGRAETKFRNGGLNLHYVHVSKDKRGRNCNVCHATHASNQEQLIRHDVPFGEWQLRVTYRKSATGGTCDTGCHPTYGYDRVNPLPTSRPASRPVTRPGEDVEGPVLARWSGSDLTGARVALPDPARPSIVLMLRADQPDMHQARQMIAAAVSDPKRARVLVVVSGQRAAGSGQPAAGSGERAAVEAAAAMGWPVVADEHFAVARQLGVQVWPAVLVVRTDATVLAHIAGTPLSLSSDLRAYLELLEGRLDEAGLRDRLARHGVVADGTDRRVAWHLEMATKLLADDKPQQARTMLAEGLRLRPDDLPLRVALIDVLLRLEQTTEAKQLLAELPKGVVPPWQSNLLRARLAYAEKRWPDARRLLEASLRQKPGVSEAHYLLGQVYEAENDWPNAARHYRAARDGMPAQVQ